MSLDSPGWLKRLRAAGGVCGGHGRRSGFVGRAQVPRVRGVAGAGVIAAGLSDCSQVFGIGWSGGGSA